jgi:hypothetical protein
MSNSKKFTYCTIAIGETYLNSAIDIANSLNKYSNNHHVLIVTDKDCKNFKNTTFVKIPNEYVLFIRDVFNYMLKFYPLYLSSKLEYDYVIFIDADWRIKETYNEEGVNLMLKYMNDNDLDILFERPHGIGEGKHDGVNCFWYHKIDFYKLKETDEYDKGHVCNEQFIVFRKNNKFNLFTEKFKELYEISTKSELWPFAEGLEMGMSMAYSDMNYDFIGWQYFVKNMFEFNSKDGGLNIKF